MTRKLLNFLLLFTSLIGYLEWSGNNHIFLFKAEAEILAKLFSNPVSVLHPLILLPLISQLLLVITLFQKTPDKLLTYISLFGLGLLLGFMFVIGIIQLNPKIIISTLPFIICALITIQHYRNH